MKICLVTAFPPSRRGLNEYGYHIARELQRDPLISLAILADHLDTPAIELEEYNVLRCWFYNRISNPTRLLSVIRDIRPDVLWFNLLFSTFGSRPIPAFFGLSIPALTRMWGIYTHVTLHHLMDNIDLRDAGVRHPHVYRWAGAVATRTLVTAQVPSVRLIIAGANHPMAPGYVESVAQRFSGAENIEFTGYVPEDRIADVFSTASVMVMPYSSATGSSGVAHLACEFGVPIISADISDFREMAADEDLAIDFYQTGNPRDLAQKLVELLRDPERQRAMAEKNFSAALRMTMPQIIRQYLRSFDLHQKSRALEPILRFRRVPAWIPSRSAIFRAAAPRWSPWM